MAAHSRIAIRPGMVAAAAALLFSTLAVACGSGERSSDTTSTGGQLIAYVVSSGSASWGGSDIYLAHADGTGRRRLTESGDTAGPAWSPDGRKLAFSCAGPTDGMGICVINADGSGRHLVSARALDRPAWSPDGKLLAAHCGFQICVLGPDGKDVRTLTHVKGEDVFSDLVWSPDSRSVAVAQRGPLGSTAFVVDVDDGTMSTVGRNAEIAGWTPDGQVVVASSEGDPTSTFYAVNRDGKDKHRLSADDRIVGPLWSPDGKQWLTSGAPEGVEMLPRKLFVADRDGKSTSTVASVEKGSYVLDSAWQPAS